MLVSQSRRYRCVMAEPELGNAQNHFLKLRRLRTVMGGKAPEPRGLDTCDCKNARVSEGDGR